MVDVDVRDAFDYPRRGEGALLTQLAGGGVPALLAVATLLLWLAALFVQPLALVALLFVPLQFAVSILWTGYFVRVARRTFAGDAEPPGLGDPIALARDGLWGTAIALVYAVPGIGMTVALYALMFASAFGMEFLSESDPAAGLFVGFGGMAVMFVGSLVVMAYFLVMGYLLPASLVAYAAEDDPRAALSWARLKPVVLSTEFAVPWMVVFAAYFVTQQAVGLLTLVLVGYLLYPLLPLVYFYLGTAAFHMFARAYATEHGLAVPDAAPDAEGSPSPAPGGTASRTPDDI